MTLKLRKTAINFKNIESQNNTAEYLAAYMTRILSNSGREVKTGVAYKKTCIKLNRFRNGLGKSIYHSLRVVWFHLVQK